MTKYTLKIDGMMCGMCESHICDCVRNNFSVKKVTASHSKGECVILAESLNEDELIKKIDETGYKLVSISSVPYEKKGFFSSFKK
ncbi:MAG: heavy-metal-associated domain-containing protein [Clostridiales bacterium]|nr:heavy-metal-associated domain-containing protein [Clostridiales bacterium]